MQNLLAANDKLIVELLGASEEKTDSGLILSDGAKGITYDKAKVVSVGQKVDTDIRQGDTVVIQKGSYFKLKIAANDFIVVPASSVYAILRD